MFHTIKQLFDRFKYVVMECITAEGGVQYKHNYKLLDVEKIANTSPRNSNTFKRTTRLFCKKCGHTKTEKEVIERGYGEERPVWTYNAKKDIDYDK